MTTGKTIALTRWTFVGKVMSLIFNMLSRLVITFLPTSKRLLISWLQSPSAVILEPPKIKSDTVSTVSPSIYHEVMGSDAMILVFWMLSFKPTFSLLPQDKYCLAFVVICRHVQNSKICELRSTASQLKSNKATLCLIISVSYCKEVSYFQSIYWCFTHLCGTSWMISMFKIVLKYSDEMLTSVAKSRMA